MTDAPTVHAVVLNWNDADHTIKCIESVQNIDYPNLNIIIVDNGSTDDSVERLQTALENVLLLASNRNRGFAGGMNLGVSEAIEAGTDYVWLLNNDVVVDDTTVLTQLINKLESNQNIGILSPLIREYPNTDEVWFAEGRIDLTDGDVGHVGRENLNEGLITTDYVPFCGPVIRDTIFEELGLLPDEYFLYYEDADYCISVREHGYRVCTDLSCHICHEANASSGGTFDPIFSYYRARNRLLFSRRHAGDKFVSSKYSWWVLKAVIHRLLNGEINSARAIIEGGIDGVKTASGRGPYP
jgi:GT2 family glycosyltransferase